MNRTRKVAAVACLTLLNAPGSAFSQTTEPDPVRMARRTTLLMSQSTSVVGSVRSQNNDVADLVVRLRDLMLGEVWGLTRTNDGGDFAFGQVPQGTYLIEVSEEEDGDPLVVSDSFTIGPSETVAVLVNLPAPTGLPTFGMALIAVLASAVVAGVTGLGGGRSASNDDQAR